MKKVILILTLLLVMVPAMTFGATGTIGWAKSLPDNTVLTKPIVGVVATTVAHPTLGQVTYILDPNRISGIIVDSVGVTGQMVQVTGTIKSTLSGERYIFGSILSSTGLGQLISPVGMSNKSATSTIGLSAEGMIATVWGKVTSLGWEGDNLYIDDGSGLRDGTLNWTEEWIEVKNQGLRVKSSNPSAYQIGDNLKFTGPIGKDMDYNGTPHKVVREAQGLPALVAPTAYAIGGNAQIYVTWDGDPCAGAYRVYRSDTETGTYSVIGQSTGIDLAYLDKPLPNGVTRWYKVSSLSGTTEGPPSLPISATTTAHAPSVSIDTLNIDSGGVLDITFSCSPGTDGTAIPMVSFDIDGAELWDDYPSVMNGSWCYDTTELTNGTHTVGVKVVSSAAGIPYVGYDKSSFTVDNDITSLFVSEIADATTPFQATFKTECDWTITVRQGATVLGQSSGTGTEIDWLWDSTAGYSGSAEVEISYTPTALNSGVQKSTASTSTSTKNKLTTFWITSQNLLAKAGHYSWATWYANDQKINAWGSWYYSDKFFRDNFTGFPPMARYSKQLTSPGDFDTVLNDFNETEEPYKITHVVWSGHGNYGSEQYNFRPNVLQANAWMANFVGQGDWWHGISPFKDYLDDGMKWNLKAIGPKIGNLAVWKKIGNGRGRPMITQMNRRMKFAVVFGCWSTKGTMALALGIPKKQIKGCKCAFIGFHNMLWGPQPSTNFSRYLFDALGRGQTAGVSVNFALKAFKEVTGDAAKGNPQLFGDPNMTVGRMAP